MSTPDETNIAITEVAIDKLRPNERNPRTITTDAFERLKKSLREDPEMMKARPIIALPDGTIIGGNMRYRAAQALGWRTVPVAYADLDEVRARQWIIRDNSEYGDWDRIALAEIVFDLGEMGADIELTGLDEKELARLIDLVAGDEHIPSESEWAEAAASMPDGEPEFTQISFVLHVDEAETVRRALDHALAAGAASELTNNRNGIALFHIAAAYIHAQEEPIEP